MLHKKEIKFLSLGMILLLAVIFSCYVLVSFTASGRIYESLEEVPRQNVALLLGTSPTGPGGKGTNMFFENRMEAAITLYNEGNDTKSSIIRAKEIFNKEEVLVVSQRFHDEKAIYLGDRYGLKIKGYVAEDSPHLLFKVKAYLREGLARVKLVFGL